MFYKTYYSIEIYKFYFKSRFFLQILSQNSLAKNHFFKIKNRKEVISLYKNKIIFFIISIIFSICLIFFQIGSFEENNKINLDAGVEKYYNNLVKTSYSEQNIINNTTNTNRDALSQNTLKDKSAESNKIKWKLEIPTIELCAEIQEGTTPEILNEYIGHFEETAKIKGNIGLAAHNRGYNVNYFSRIKELEKGDEIFYSYKGIRIKYVVDKKEIIDDTNWKVLENTNENKITLITCVENQPTYRLCVQGIKSNL